MNTRQSKFGIHSRRSLWKSNILMVGFTTALSSKEAKVVAYYRALQHALNRKTIVI